MSRTGEVFTATIIGLFGSLLVVGSIRSLLDGRAVLRRFSAPIDQGLPIVLLLGLLGQILVIGSIVYVVRSARGRNSL